jgi:hypothetical protein
MVGKYNIFWLGAGKYNMSGSSEPSVYRIISLKKLLLFLIFVLLKFVPGLVVFFSSSLSARANF